MNLLMAASGSSPSSSKMKKTAVPRIAKQAIKYNAPNPMMIFRARLVPKEAERVKDFHSSLIKCLNMLLGFRFCVLVSKDSKKLQLSLQNCTRDKSLLGKFRPLKELKPRRHIRLKP